MQIMFEEGVMVGLIYPDKYIKIGLKDNKVVLVDWAELSDQFVDQDSDDVINHIRDLLDEAKMFINMR